MTANEAPANVPAVYRAQDSYDFKHSLGEDFAGSSIQGLAGSGTEATVTLEDGRKYVYHLDLTDRLWRLSASD